MSFKVRSPRVKLGKGTYLRFGKNGASITRRTRYVTQTTNLETGKVRTTVKTPIKGVSYVEENGGTKLNGKLQSEQEQKKHSPTTYKVCGSIALVIGVLAGLLSILTLSVGGWMILLFAIPLTYLGIFYLKASNQ